MAFNVTKYLCVGALFQIQMLNNQSGSKFVSQSVSQLVNQLFSQLVSESVTDTKKLHESVIN